MHLDGWRIESVLDACVLSDKARVSVGIALSGTLDPQIPTHDRGYRNGVFTSRHLARRGLFIAVGGGNRQGVQVQPTHHPWNPRAIIHPPLTCMYVWPCIPRNRSIGGDFVQSSLDEASTRNGRTGLVLCVLGVLVLRRTFALLDIGHDRRVRSSPREEQVMEKRSLHGTLIRWSLLLLGYSLFVIFLGFSDEVTLN